MKKMISLAVAVGLLVLACGEEEDIAPPPPPPSVSTPADALNRVEYSFNQRDVDYLKKSLCEDFVFHFDPRDVRQSPPGKPEYKIPGSWSRDEFLAVVNNMFRKAHTINLSITTARVGTPAENETTYLADNVPISLLVMVDELNGFIADKGYCNFELEKYTTKDGKKYWRLTAWWDRTSEFLDESPGVGPASLGKILAIFI